MQMRRRPAGKSKVLPGMRKAGAETGAETGSGPLARVPAGTGAKAGGRDIGHRAVPSIRTPPCRRYPGQKVGPKVEDIDKALF